MILAEEPRAPPARYRDVIAREAQGVVPGCTEIMLLVKPEDSAVPLFAQRQPAVPTTAAVAGTGTAG